MVVGTKAERLALLDMVDRGDVFANIKSKVVGVCTSIVLLQCVDGSSRRRKNGVGGGSKSQQDRRQDGRPGKVPHGEAQQRQRGKGKWLGGLWWW